MNSGVLFRTILASMVLAALLLLGNFRLLRWTVSVDFSFIGHDEVTLYEKRLARVRDALPPYGVIGYIDDNSGQSVQRFKEYFLTQYTVAPLILADPDFPGPDPAILTRDDVLIISNIHHSKPDQRIFAERHVFLLEDFGNGLQLY